MDDKFPQALRSLLRQKLIDAVQRPLPQLTRRDTWIPRIPGKTLAVIGMRRSGKTSLLWQQVDLSCSISCCRVGLPWLLGGARRLRGSGPVCFSMRSS